jgi:hypothetical protein
MPPTSEQLPLLGIYYAITIGIVSLSTAMTVLTLNIDNRGLRGQELPKLVKKIFFKYIARILRIQLESVSNKKLLNKRLLNEKLHTITNLNNNNNNNINSTQKMNDEDIPLQKIYKNAKSNSVKFVSNYNRHNKLPHTDNLNLESK